MFGFHLRPPIDPGNRPAQALVRKGALKGSSKPGQKQASSFYPSDRISGRSFPGALVIDIITQIEARIPRKLISISDGKLARGAAGFRLTVPEMPSMRGTPHRTRKDQTRKMANAHSQINRGL